MPQAAASKGKNRRYRGAKISEYRLRRVVECFARDMTAKDAAEATKLSKPSVEAIYRRLRERLAEHPLVRFDLGPTPPPETRAVINRKTGGTAPADLPPPETRAVINRKTGGTAPADLPLHEMALITRILNAQHFAGFEELSAANPAHVAKAVRLMKANGNRRYNIYEKLAKREGDTAPRTRPFDPLRYETTSTILVNEMKADPHAAHFQYIWKLLLKHPL